MDLGTPGQGIVHDKTSTLSNKTPFNPPTDEVYQPQDAIAVTTTSTLVMGGFGTLASAIQNTLTRQNYGAFGIFTRTGGTIALFAVMGGSYSFVKCASANLRERDDHYNSTLGGFFAGTMLGLRARSLPAVLGYGATMAIAMAAFDYTGGSLKGLHRDPDEDEFERKQSLRKNRRRPIGETLQDLGEGRGIYGPGYQERRRETLKQKYGVDVPQRSAAES
ncbi:hypothetical protein MMC25_004685 [Agyrium rufum]|nr:hypothetical protein [Agyrium rufum]